MTAPSPIALRLLAYLKAASQGKPIPWETIVQQAAKSNVRLTRDMIVNLANELKSLGYPIHSTKQHEFYYGESEMFEGQIQRVIKQLENEWDAVRM